jgi:hypothetical protein
MSDDLDRSKVTFEQAEGLEPLPSQLKPKELSPALRASLWHILYQHLLAAVAHVDFSENVLRDPWQTILYDAHVFRDHLPANTYNPRSTKRIEELSTLFMTGSYDKVLGLLQFILRHQLCPQRFAGGIAGALQRCKADYRLADDRRTLMPIASEEEAEVARKAFVALNASEYGGARTHLATASERLTAGDSPGAVRESIQAVESVARVITSEKSFGDALIALEKRWKIHPALKRGFGAIYGYTSDEEGIRHPLLDDATAQVDELDALFMFGACAAFISYLIGKAKANAPAAG